MSRRRCQGCRVSGIHRSDRLWSRRPLTAAAGYATSCNFAFAIAAGHVFHAKIPFCSPLLSRHIPQSGANQHQSRLSVRKSADNAGSSPDLTVHALSASAGTENPYGSAFPQSRPPPFSPLPSASSRGAALQRLLLSSAPLPCSPVHGLP